MTEGRTPEAAIAQVIQDKSLDRPFVSGVCFGMFGVQRFSELDDGQKWTLVCKLDPNAIGPYGHSMEPFA